MRFRYTRFAVAPSPVDRSRAILRPMLRVVVGEIGDETKSVPISGRLDTGSDVSILPFADSEAIRPVWRSGVEVLRDYTGGLRTIRFGAVYLRIRLVHKILRWAAVVAFDDRRRDEALWGISGFLEYFNVRFAGPEQHFTLRLRGATPPGFETEPIPKPRRIRPRDSIIDPDQQGT
jgi:hypothetical protein